MEIRIIGEGEVVVRYINARGETLLQERLLVSGPPDVEAIRHIPLSIGTVGGPVELAPVLVSANREFDGGDPARFVRARCRAIGCAIRVASDAAKGVAPLPIPQTTGVLNVEPDMSAIARAATSRKPRRR